MKKQLAYLRTGHQQLMAKKQLAYICSSHQQSSSWWQRSNWLIYVVSLVVGDEEAIGLFIQWSTLGGDAEEFDLFMQWSPVVGDGEVIGWFMQWSPVVGDEEAIALFIQWSLVIIDKEAIVLFMQQGYFQALCYYCKVTAKTQSIIGFRNLIFCTNTFSYQLFKLFSKNH